MAHNLYWNNQASPFHGSERSPIASIYDFFVLLNEQNYLTDHSETRLK